MATEIDRHFKNLEIHGLWAPWKFFLAGIVQFGMVIVEGSNGWRVWHI